MKRFLLMLLLSLVAAGAAQRRIPPDFCTGTEPDSENPLLSCPCTRIHPEWCKTDDPYPSCCRVYEKRARGCGCCAAPKKE